MVWRLLFALVGMLLVGSECLVITRRLGSESLSKKGLEEVISILQTMLTQFVQQASSDQDAWERYQRWAQETETDRTEFARNQAALVMANTATHSAKTQEVQQSGEELTQLASDITTTMTSMSELVTMRHDEHKQHEASVQELMKTIKAVDKATDILEGHYSGSAAALTEIKQQVEFAVTLASAGQRTSAFNSLMQDPNWLDVDGAQQHGSYQGQGGAGGVMGTLKDLRSTLDSNRQESVEKESQAVRDFESARSANQGQLTRLEEQVTAKTAQKQQAEAAITQAQATIDMANRQKTEAEGYLQTLAGDVSTFQEEYQTRTRVRDDEKSATQSAYDALQSVSAGAKESAGSLLQKVRKKVCPSCAKEAKKLSSISKKLGGSTALAQVVGELEQRSQASFDPSAMDPVKELLGTLITRLENEMSAETTHHDWCETEKTSSQSAKEQKVANVEALRGTIERLSTSVSQLGGELTFLAGEMNRVTQETEEATRNRNAAHEAFSKAKSDHDEVINAIETAAKALGDQYSFIQGKNAAKLAAKAPIKPYSLIQGQKESPFESYQGGSGSAGSASEMLADLLKRYSEARTGLVNDENVADAAFRELEATNNQFVADSQNESNSKMTERRGKLSQLKNAKEEMKNNFLELQEIATYLQDLRPSCDDIRSTFEERKRRREAEISALQECLDVLSDPSAMA